jgi:rubrerythrin
VIDELGPFLAHAIRLEADAAETYERLAREMEGRINPEVAALFSRFAAYSRMHLAEARERAIREVGDLPQLSEPDFQWPDGRSPETPAPADLERLGVRGALELALATERQACDFYATVAGQTRSERVQELAQEFAEEEAEHVVALERWLAQPGRPRAP